MFSVSISLLGRGRCRARVHVRVRAFLLVLVLVLVLVHVHVLVLVLVLVLALLLFLRTLAHPPTHIPAHTYAPALSVSHILVHTGNCRRIVSGACFQRMLGSTIPTPGKHASMRERWRCAKS